MTVNRGITQGIRVHGISVDPHKNEIKATQPDNHWKTYYNRSECNHHLIQIGTEKGNKTWRSIESIPQRIRVSVATTWAKQKQNWGYTTWQSVENILSWIWVQSPLDPHRYTPKDQSTQYLLISLDTTWSTPNWKGYTTWQSVENIPQWIKLQSSLGKQKLRMAAKPWPLLENIPQQIRVQLSLDITWSTEELRKGTQCDTTVCYSL